VACGRARPEDLEDALDIRRRVLLAFERAERDMDAADRQPLLTFVVVGGGPTGVEMAGALAEMSRQSLARDFRHFDPGSSRIVLLEGGPSLLPAFPDRLRRAAQRDLERVGVEVRVGSVVTDLAPGRVWIGEEALRAETVIWAAGVAASPLGRSIGAPLDRAGRVRVTPELTVPGVPNVSSSETSRRSTVLTDIRCRAWHRSPSRWGSTPPGTYARD
jgi:NADH:ubiquinone reductase (H+-translocating)